MDEYLLLEHHDLLVPSREYIFRLWLALPYGKKRYVEPKGLYTDSQFDSLFAFVRSQVKRLCIRTVVINNAQLIDGWTLEALVLLRKHCGHTLSVILRAQLAEKADLDEPLDEAFGRVPEAAEICTRVVLQLLTKKEYQAVILPALAENLNLSFADDLLEAGIAKRVPNPLWQHTNFDWKAIDDFAKDIKQKYQTRKMVDHAS